MATPLRISIPHQLGRAEARRRIETGFSKLLSQLPGSGGCSERWEGDRMAFSVAAMGQAVTGSVEVLETTVTIDVELPGLLGHIAGAFKGRLQRAGQLLLNKD